MPEIAEANTVSIAAQITTVKAKLSQTLDGYTEPSVDAFRDIETQLIELHRNQAALEAALKLQQQILFDESVSRSVEELLGELQGKFRMVSWRTVGVMFLGGIRIKIAMPYYSRNCAPKKGIYPHAAILGIVGRMTSAVGSLAARFATALASFKEAAGLLEVMGISLDVKTLTTITKGFAARARAGQSAENVRTMTSPDSSTGSSSENEKEKEESTRVVVSTDGGRVRVRKRKRGPKGKKGRGRYHAEWREPKLIIILMVDDRGRQDQKFPPIIDATMAGPDAAFALLELYLRRLSLKSATVSFVSDGAKWIWKRVKELFTNLRIEASEIIELLDFYHVSEHLSAIANLKRGWSDSERGRWIKKMKKWLKQGYLDRFIEKIKEVTKGTHSKILKRERRYFLKNRHRLGYKSSRDRGMPIGSGAVESAIRRVINLRLKGPGIIWNEDTVEDMLFLRSYFKAGRWSQLERWANNSVILAG